MADRKARRIREKEIKLKPNAKKQLVIMLIAMVLMFFSVSQVYFLARYTLRIRSSTRKIKCL